MRKNEFTLIELLVVIAIIAILAGMLLPALGKAKSSAHVITCAGNLKTLSLGIMLYTDGNDGWFGPINKNSGGSPQNSPWLWVNQLYVNKYIEAKNRDGEYHAANASHDDEKYTAVLACPFAVYSEPLKQGWRVGSPSYASADYGFNWHLSSGGNGFHRMDRIKNPSSRLVLADANSVAISDNTYPTVSGKFTVMYRHNGVSASAMAGDGSIQAVKQTKFSLDGSFR